MKSLRSYIEEGMQQFDKRKLGISPTDPATHNMLNLAKLKYPMTQGNDIEALATLVRRANQHSIDDNIKLTDKNDAEEEDIDKLEIENDAEEADIDKLEIENDRENLAINASSKNIAELIDEIDQLRRQISVLLSKP